ncbi:hypothetical protein FOQG_12569 [Fusarium oxysporum f. sp. raphani 54005]|uniref:Uncharacterized protein n=1 Tax=Fusarium oxysporum f. sp. raphani 54005 TaxID=1089458 RepID=X0CL15_FUSOX|nr:hypothetical protein FOQG_12569 [Fusarium oxysporum f. sp. raphani 54005]
MTEAEANRTHLIQATDVFSLSAALHSTVTRVGRLRINGSGRLEQGQRTVVLL